MQPYLCPVCLGKMTVPYDFYEDCASEYSTSAKNIKKVQCRTCSGTGIIWDYTNNYTYAPIQENNEPKDTCENCPVRLNPNWNGVCHCALPYIVNPRITW